MAEEGDKTFEQLRADAMAEWQRIQAVAAASHAEYVDKLRKMPDVAGAPSRGDVYRHEWIMCPCGETEFLCTRWVTVNGEKHRAELECQRCKAIRTWDWPTRRWLN